MTVIARSEATKQSIHQRVKNGLLRCARNDGGGSTTLPQTRLTKAGFDTGGTDGRVGNDTMAAVRDYQTKVGISPADGYGGLQVLARLRQGN